VQEKQNMASETIQNMTTNFLSLSMGLSKLQNGSNMSLDSCDQEMDVNVIIDGANGTMFGTITAERKDPARKQELNSKWLPVDSPESDTDSHDFDCDCYGCMPSPAEKAKAKESRDRLRKKLKDQKNGKEEKKNSPAKTLGNVDKNINYNGPKELPKTKKTEKSKREASADNVAKVANMIEASRKRETFKECEKLAEMIETSEEKAQSKKQQKKAKKQQMQNDFEETMKTLQELNENLATVNKNLKQVNQQLNDLKANKSSKKQKLALAQQKLKELSKIRAGLEKETRTACNIIKTLKPETNLTENLSALTEVISVLFPPAKIEPIPKKEEREVPKSVVKNRPKVEPKPKKEVAEVVKPAAVETPKVPASLPLYTIVDGKLIPIELKLDAAQNISAIPKITDSNNNAQVKTTKKDISLSPEDQSEDWRHQSEPFVPSWYKSGVWSYPHPSMNAQNLAPTRPSRDFKSPIPSVHAHEMAMKPKNLTPTRPFPEFKSSLVTNENGIYTVRSPSVAPSFNQFNKCQSNLGYSHPTVSYNKVTYYCSF
jgi:chemotaxis protein histidine kinase CheA